MLDIGVVDLSELVLFALRDELGSIPLIARLLLEDCTELLLSLLNIVEWRPLMHTILTNAAITSQYNVKLSVGVKDDLHLVINIIAIWTILQVNFGHIRVPRLARLRIIVDSVLLLGLELHVDRHVVELLLLLEDLFCSLLLSFLEEGSCILRVAVLELGPLSFWCQ